MTRTDIITKYGNPDANGDHQLDLGWAQANLKRFKLPYALYLSWEPQTSIIYIQAHRLIGERIIAAYEDLRNDVTIEFMRANKWDRWGGCFEFRNVRGGSELSMHAFGLAVDHCPDLGPLGDESARDTYPPSIIDAFVKNGFIWGGSLIFKRADAMHFEIGV